VEALLLGDDAAAEAGRRQRAYGLMHLFTVLEYEEQRRGAPVP
jgi:hypothetical protein